MSKKVLTARSMTPVDLRRLGIVTASDDGAGSGDRAAAKEIIDTSPRGSTRCGRSPLTGRAANSVPVEGGTGTASAKPDLAVREGREPELAHVPVSSAEAARMDAAT